MILGILFFVVMLTFFLGGIQVVMKKYFGTEIVPRSRYREAQKMSGIRNQVNNEKLQKLDPRIIELAKENLKRKHLAPTIDNLIEEIIEIQSRTTKRR